MEQRMQIVGAGKLGRTMARLWQSKRVFAVDGVVNQSLESSQAAVAFIGAGRAIGSVEELGPWSLMMIATSDRAIAQVAIEVAAKSQPLPGAVVFHCSGSLSSELLAPLRAKGCSVASLHPALSFADPALAVTNFPGTMCALEGDEAAVTLLTKAITAIEGKCFAVDGRHKTLYHAASVFANNYGNAMLEAASRCLRHAGLDEAQSKELLTGIAQATVANFSRLGTIASVTGPIARGEAEVVSRQLEALTAWQPTLAEAYRAAGGIVLEMAHSQNKSAAGALESVAQVLGQKR